MEDFAGGCTPFCLDLLQLKRNDNYFYQIMTQMAVTGLKYDKKQKIRQMTFILDISSIYIDSVVLTMTEPVVP